MNNKHTSEGNPDVVKNGNTIKDNSDNVKMRFEMLLELFHRKFQQSLADDYKDKIFISKELLHCAVKAYNDDIERYIAYAGSEYPSCYKEAAYTMKWINRFRPIQIKEHVEADSVLVTINQSFAIYASFAFLDPSVAAGISRKFFDHLVYTLTYRPMTGKMLATLLYAVNRATENNGEI